MKKYAVIMAGGTGSRLWPISREKKPKQFISADGDQCMLVQTIERIRQSVPLENCFVITNGNLLDITQNILRNMIPACNIITEPLRKNTAACISYASLLLKNKFEDGVICFFPADGYVKNKSAYQTAIDQAYKTAENSNSLVIIGITPSYPATGYGYIEVNADNDSGQYPVVEFVEKPDYKTAEGFLSLGNYWWNSGIVAGRLDTFLDHVKLFLPVHYHEFSVAIRSTHGQDVFECVKKAYDRIPNISFDKGVLEKSSKILAIKGVFDWDDIGNLESLAISLNPDEKGNMAKGKFLGIDTRDSIIYSGEKLVTAIGISNMVIAVTDDAVLICPRSRVQDIKMLVDLLKDKDYQIFI